MKLNDDDDLNSILNEVDIGAANNGSLSVKKKKKKKMNMTVSGVSLSRKNV